MKSVGPITNIGSMIRYRPMTEIISVLMSLLAVMSMVFTGSMIRIGSTPGVGSVTDEY